MLKNKKLFLYLFLIITTFSFVSNNLFEEMGLELPEGANQFLVIAFFSMFWIYFGKSKFIMPGYKKILLFMAIYLLIALFFSEGTFLNYMVGFAMTFLFVYVFILASNLKLQIEDLLWLMKSMFSMIVALTMFSIYQIIFEEVEFRNGFSMFRHSSWVGGILSCGLVFSFSLFLIFRKKIYFYTALLISSLVLLSTYKKTFISMTVIWFFFLIWDKKNKLIKISLLLLISLGIGILYFQNGWNGAFSDTIDNYENNYDKIPRYLLLETAFKIALNKFPFGSGLGTFASVPSIKMGYSHMYQDYGLSNSWGLSFNSIELGHNFTLDCFWAHIIAELGFFGTIAFVWLYSFPAFYIFKKFEIKSGNNLERGLSFFVIVISFIMMLEGLSTYYFENSSFIIFHSGLVGMAFRLLLNQKMTEKKMV